MIKDKCFYTVITKQGKVVTGKAYTTPNFGFFIIGNRAFFDFMVEHIEPVFDELDEDGYI